MGIRDADDESVTIPIRTLVLAGLSLVAFDADRILAKHPEPETASAAQIQHIENALEDIRYDIRAARADQHRLQSELQRKIDSNERSILVVGTQISLINTRRGDG